jgi:hypothetical protein
VKIFSKTGLYLFVATDLEVVLGRGVTALCVATQFDPPALIIHSKEPTQTIENCGLS